MKKRRGSLLQRMMAVLLSAVLVTGMVSNAAPFTVLAQEQEETQESVSENTVKTEEGETDPEDGGGTSEYIAYDGLVMAQSEDEGIITLVMTMNVYGYEEGYFKSKVHFWGVDYEPLPSPQTTVGEGYTKISCTYEVSCPKGLASSIAKLYLNGWSSYAKACSPGSNDIGQTKTYDVGNVYAVRYLDGEKIVSLSYISPVSGDDAQMKISYSKPADPQKEGYVFAGWVTENGGSTPFDFDTTIDKATDVYASWTVVQDTNIASGTDWTLDADGKLTISSDEGMTDWISRGREANKTAVKSVVIQGGVTSIRDRAFFNCSSLASIEIPSGVTSIGEAAFNGCSSLGSITIPDSVTSIGDVAFNGCSSLGSITIPDSVTSIGYSAFGGCSKLTSITIPSKVTSIEQAAFNGCSSLASIEIPSGVTSIGEAAFGGCSKLTSITIPSKVTSIGDMAFNGCSSLASVTMKNENPPTLLVMGGLGSDRTSWKYDFFWL